MQQHQTEPEWNRSDQRAEITGCQMIQATISCSKFLFLFLHNNPARSGRTDLRSNRLRWESGGKPKLQLRLETSLQTQLLSQGRPAGGSVAHRTAALPPVLIRPRPTGDRRLSYCAFCKTRLNLINAVNFKQNHIWGAEGGGAGEAGSSRSETGGGGSPRTAALGLTETFPPEQKQKQKDYRVHST